MTVTFPHSRSIPGWWNSSSARLASLLVNARASLKFLNLNTRSSWRIPLRSMTCHSGTMAFSLGRSSWVTFGAPAWQASHFISDNFSGINLFFEWLGRFVCGFEKSKFYSFFHGLEDFLFVKVF